MAGKHSAASKKSKAPVIIIISVAAAAVIAAAVIAILYFNGAFGNKDNQQATTAPTATSAAATTVAGTAQTTTAQASSTASGSSNQSSQQEIQSSVIVPTEESGDITYFNATFIPNGTVVDTYTGANTSLREVFGSGYNTEGVITFNSDGSFKDSVSSDEAMSGGYVVQNEKIIATYSNDKNMEITVTDWDGNVPVSFYITYAGYNVYFG